MCTLTEGIPKGNAWNFFQRISRGIEAHSTSDLLSSFQKFVEFISEEISAPINRIFGASGDEITSVNLIRENEILYASSGEEFIQTSSKLGSSSRQIIVIRLEKSIVLQYEAHVKALSYRVRSLEFQVRLLRHSVQRAPWYESTEIVQYFVHSLEASEWNSCSLLNRKVISKDE